VSDWSPKLNDDFPEWYTIDTDGLDSLVYFLKKHYQGKTILIGVESVQDEGTADAHS
jgi:hypothetical protein